MDQGPSPSLLEREVVSTLPLAEKKASFKPLKISARATIYPGHFPEPSPRPAPSAPCVSAFSSPAVFPGQTQRAGAAWQQLCPLQKRCLETSAQLPLRAGVPISSLGVVGEGPVVASRLYPSHRSPPAPGECCVSLGSGLLALLLSSLTPCGERDRGHRDTPSRLLSH